MNSYRKTPFPIGNTDENWQYHQLGDFRESRRIREFHPRAEDLVLSKSEVSKQIVGLEERLGARLLNRTTRRLSVTNTGARLFERCQSIVAEIEAAELEAGELLPNPRASSDCPRGCR